MSFRAATLYCLFYYGGQKRLVVTGVGDETTQTATIYGSILTCKPDGSLDLTSAPIDVTSAIAHGYPLVCAVKLSDFDSHTALAPARRVRSSIEHAITGMRLESRRPSSSNHWVDLVLNEFNNEGMFEADGSFFKAVFEKALRSYSATSQVYFCKAD